MSRTTKKALSLQQPWATLMTELAAITAKEDEPKEIENRDWYTNFRGECYVHASKGWDKVNFPINKDGTFEIDAGRADGRQLPFPPGMSRRVEDYQRGGIVGKFTVFDCVRESNNVWFFGKYGFLVKDAKPVPFVACKGALNFFELPSDVLAQLAPASAPTFDELFAQYQLGFAQRVRRDALPLIRPKQQQGQG